jgi:hypothetical protein
LKEDIKSKDKNNENTTQKTEDQRSLQKPWKNLMMNNVDHYKNLGWFIPGLCTGRRWSSLGSSQVFEVVDVGHL